MHGRGLEVLCSSFFLCSSRFVRVACLSCLFGPRVELSHVETTSHSLRRIVLWIQEDNKAWRKGKGYKDALSSLIMMKLGVRSKAVYVSACESSSFFVRVAVLELLVWVCRCSSYRFRTHRSSSICPRTSHSKLSQRASGRQNWRFSGGWPRSVNLPLLFRRTGLDTIAQWNQNFTSTSTSTFALPLFAWTPDSPNFLQPPIPPALSAMLFLLYPWSSFCTANDLCSGFNVSIEKATQTTQLEQTTPTKKETRTTKLAIRSSSPKCICAIHDSAPHTRTSAIGLRSIRWDRWTRSNRILIRTARHTDATPETAMMMTAPQRWARRDATLQLWFFARVSMRHD